MEHHVQIEWTLISLTRDDKDMAYKIINFLDGLSKEEIDVVGTTGQVQISSDDDTSFFEYFDTAEEAQSRVETLEAEMAATTDDNPVE